MFQKLTRIVLPAALTIAFSGGVLAQEDETTDPGLIPVDKPGRPAETTEEGLLADPGTRMLGTSPKTRMQMEREMEELHSNLGSRISRLQNASNEREIDALVAEQREDLLAYLAELEAMVPEEPEVTLESLQANLDALEAEAEAGSTADLMAGIRQHMAMMREWQEKQSETD